MKIPHEAVSDLLWESGCLKFADQAGDEAVAELLRMRPEMTELLSDEAKRNLRTDWRKRFELIYYQPLMKAVLKRMENTDPAEMMFINRRSIDVGRRIARQIELETGDRMKDMLWEEFPLLAEYDAVIRKNYLDSYIDFFDALLQKKEEISRCLLGQKTFNKVLRISSEGADLHRHGRSVLGVWTDAGAFYYKPHDCGLDALYRELVSAWFSDCTMAPDVVRGEGFAFVSCLTQEPVKTEAEISKYFYHFGILTALFHGLGSIDMHMENIMACGVRPSAIDLETLVTARHRRKNSGEEMTLKRTGFSDSVHRIGIMPKRLYRGQNISPLYAVSRTVVSLPEYQGRHYTVEGYEDIFTEGFHEGYRRMLVYRPEILQLLEKYKRASVRSVFLNTTFYNLIRHMLFRPEYLKSEADREKVLGRLLTPYERQDAFVDDRIIAYERSCLMQADIPYFCTALEGRDLCGESPDYVLSENHFKQSGWENAVRRLNRLSERELCFEEDTIRVSFDQAPLDVPVDPERLHISEGDAAPGDIRAMVTHIFRNLQANTITGEDGSLMWFSTASQLEEAVLCGKASGAADAGSCCAAILSSPKMSDLHEDAARMAAGCIRSIEDDVRYFEGIDEETLQKSMAPGLFGGLGGILQGCRQMSRVNIPGAGELTERLIRLIRVKMPFGRWDLTAGFGVSGLILALSGLPETEDLTACVRVCADRLLQGALPAIPDVAKGAAGVGAALAAAGTMLGDERCIRKSLGAFDSVLRSYDHLLGGWPDSRGSARFSAERGTQAAGIAITAGDAMEWLSSTPGKSVLDEIRGLAMDSLRREEYLYHSDSLNQGNALSAHCFLRAGETKRAGQILDAMIRRQEMKGCFTINDPGIRSFFDPAWYLGTGGCVLPAVGWLNASPNAEL